MGGGTCRGDLMLHFGVTDEDVDAKRFTPEFRDLMAHLVAYTLEMLRQGGAISGLVDRELATHARSLSQGRRGLSWMRLQPRGNGHVEAAAQGVESA